VWAVATDAATVGFPPESKEVVGFLSERKEAPEPGVRSSHSSIPGYHHSQPWDRILLLGRGYE